MATEEDALKTEMVLEQQEEKVELRRMIDLCYRFQFLGCRFWVLGFSDFFFLIPILLGS